MRQGGTATVPRVTAPDEGGAGGADRGWVAVPAALPASLAAGRPRQRPGVEFLPPQWLAADQPGGVAEAGVGGGFFSSGRRRASRGEAFFVVVDCGFGWCVA